MACGLKIGRLLSRLYFAHLSLSLLLTATKLQPSSSFDLESDTHCKKMSKRLFPLLLLASALWQLSMANPVDSTITPAAVLPRQEVDNDFIGWFLKSSGSTSSCKSRSTFFALY